MLTRARRSELATAALATVPVSFLLTGWLQAEHPVASPVEATELTLLRIAWTIGLCAAFALIPKTMTPPGTEGPLWERRLKFSLSVEWPTPWQRFVVVFLGSAALWLAALLLLGRPIARLLVAA